MTVPAFRSIASQAYGARTSSVVSAPAGIANGDILVAVMTYAGATDPGASAITPPSGFAAVSTPTLVSFGGFNGRFAIWWKRAASESGSYTFAHGGSASYSTNTALLAYSGCISSGSPVDVFSTNSGTGTVSTALSVTTTVADTMLVIGGHNWDIAGADAVTGGTERYDNLTTVCDKPQPTAAATGNLTYPSGSTSGDPWQSWMIALKPVAAAGGAGKPVKVWSGSAWVTKPVKVWSGSAWVAKPAKVWNGSAWV